MHTRYNPNSQLIVGDEEKYEYIIAKLDNTFRLHLPKFPELLPIQKQIDAIELDGSYANPYTFRLVVIKNLLDSLTDSYVVRHLHHNFGKELQAYLEGGILYRDEYESYIVLPG